MKVLYIKGSREKVRAKKLRINFKKDLAERKKGLPLQSLKEREVQKRTLRVEAKKMEQSA